MVFSRRSRAAITNHKSKITNFPVSLPPCFLPIPVQNSCPICPCKALPHAGIYGIIALKFPAGNNAVKDQVYTLEVKNRAATLAPEGAGSSETLGPASSVPAFNSPYELVFFSSYVEDGAGNRTYSNGAAMDFYYCRIYELENGEEVLKHEFLPCRVNGTNALADTVTQVVLYNGNGRTDQFSIDAGDVLFHPYVSANLADNGFTTAVLDYTLDSYGAGYDAADLAVVYATDAGFTQGVVTQALPALSGYAALGQTRSVTLQGLAHSTGYFARVVELYVATTGDDANTGYTPAQAKATVAAALAAATEDVLDIRILPGEYVTSQELMVSKPLTISGYNTTDPAAVVITNASGTSRVMTLSNEVAVVAGVTLAGGNGVARGGGIYIATGLLSNSVVVANKATTTGNGVYMANTSSAVLMDCLVTDNVSSARGGGGGISCGGTAPLIYRTVIRRSNIGGNYHKGGGVLGGTLYDCEISDNRATAIGIINGAGAADSILYRCKVLRNTCPYDGAGLYRCTAYDCLIMGNRSTGKVVTGAAGVDGGTCYNCTIVSNVPSSPEYAGVTGATLYNCIVAGNATLDGVTNNYTTGTFNYTCVSPLPLQGTGNIDADPRLNADGTLGEGSPCVNKGSAEVAYFPNEAARPADLAGGARIALGRLDMGCFEKQATEPLDISLDLDKTPVAGTAGVAVVCAASLTADAGTAVSVPLDFGDGTTTTTNLTGTGALLDFSISHTYAHGGAYTVSAAATVTDGVATNTSSDTALNKFRIPAAEGRDLYVSTTGSDGNDGFGWATAKATPFSAAVAVLSGHRIHIAAGEYLVDEQIVIDKEVEVIGEGTGPEAVVLTGCGTCRLLNVSSAGAVVRGLTVRNGKAAYGAGAFLQAGTITGCVFVGNTATGRYTNQRCTAAGVFMLNGNTARVSDCLFTNNTGFTDTDGVAVASPNNNDTAIVTGCRFTGNRLTRQNAGGVAHRVTLKDCLFEHNNFSIQNMYGGCAYECTVYRCIFRYNSIGWNGGGVAVSSSKVYDSLIHDNALGRRISGAASGGTLYNCTIVNNVATPQENGYVAGVCSGTWNSSGGTLYRK